MVKALRSETDVARILVVDDDPLFLTIMNRALEKANHEVVTAADGAKAIELFRNGNFDCLVCDLVLPNPGPNTATTGRVGFSCWIRSSIVSNCAAPASSTARRVRRLASGSTTAMSKLAPSTGLSTVA